MKKLMLMAGVMLFAVCANAASINWLLTCGNLKDHSGNAFQGQYELFATGGGLTSDLSVLTVADSGATYNKYAFTVDSGMSEGAEYSFYYVLTDKDGYQFTSETKGTFTALTVGASTVAFGNQATATSDASSWAAAPEPTSGLLLLLGLSGLALRRKRA